MKKLCFLLAALIIAAAFCACSVDKEDRADIDTVTLLKAVLARDTEKLDSLTHPDMKSAVVYGDGFYESLSELGVTVGKPLDGVTAVSKRVSSEEDLGGKVYVCEYMALIDQMPYSVTVMFLDSDSGFGVAGANFDFCTDAEYYYSEE